MRKEARNVVGGSWEDKTPTRVSSSSAALAATGTASPGPRTTDIWPTQARWKSFIADYGTFPAAQQRRRATTSSTPMSAVPADSTTTHTETSRLHLRVLQLQEVVRCPSNVITKLQAA